MAEANKPCVAGTYNLDLQTCVVPLTDGGTWTNRGLVPGSIFKAVIHTGSRGRGRVGLGERPRRLFPRTISDIVT